MATGNPALGYLPWGIICTPLWNCTCMSRSPGGRGPLAGRYPAMAMESGVAMAVAHFGARASIDIRGLQGVLAAQAPGASQHESTSTTLCRAFNDAGLGAATPGEGAVASPEPTPPSSPASTSTDFDCADPCGLFKVEDPPLVQLFGAARIWDARQGHLAVAQAEQASIHARAVAAAVSVEGASSAPPPLPPVLAGVTQAVPATRPKASPPLKRGAAVEWEVAPARRDAPGRRAFQRGSELLVNEIEASPTLSQRQVVGPRRAEPCSAIGLVE